MKNTVNCISSKRFCCCCCNRISPSVVISCRRKKMAHGRPYVRSLSCVDLGVWGSGQAASAAVFRLWLYCNKCAHTSNKRCCAKIKALFWLHIARRGSIYREVSLPALHTSRDGFLSVLPHLRRPQYIVITLEVVRMLVTELSRGLKSALHHPTQASSRGLHP